MSTMWKEEIEKSLAEMSELREQLHPIEFSSKLWDEYKGAYGDVREDVAFLFCPKELLPEMEKIRRLDFEEKGDEQIVFDNLCENLSHQLSFYGATYLAMPYLVLLLEKKRREQDFDWQMQIIMEAGIILSTDIPYEGSEEDEDRVPEEIMESYHLSIEHLKEMTKEFLSQNMDKIKETMSPSDLQYFCTAILAILGDSQAAFQMVMGSWEQCMVCCPECDYYDEDMEADGFYDEEQMKEKVEPAESVIGKWDGKSFEDTYLWFSNLAHMLGMEDDWKIAYYYGTYTCPECGSKGTLIEWMKAYELNQ